MIRFALLFILHTAVPVVRTQYMGYGAFGGYPVNPMMVNPFGMPTPYGLNPLYDAMMYADCIGLTPCPMGVPYGGYGMYGGVPAMNGMTGMTGMGMNGMNGMAGGMGGGAVNGMNGMNNVQSNVGTLNNGNTMRTSMNRLAGSRTRYGPVGQGCQSVGCNSGNWWDYKKLKV